MFNLDLIIAMTILKKTKKLLLAAGCGAGCGAGLAFIISNLNVEYQGFKVRAANGIQNHFSEQLTNGSLKWNLNWDKRERLSLVEDQNESSLPFSKKDENNNNEKPEKTKIIATRHLILIRHGQYNTNGDSDENHSLTQLGRDQANLVGLRLKELSLPYTRIVHSTMTRATQTAEIISKHLPKIPVNNCNFICEGLPIAPEPSIPLSKDMTKMLYSDGARIEAAFRKYFHRADATQTKDSYEILVCHANVIRYFICRALQFSPQAWLRFSLHNCSLTWIKIRPSGYVSVYTMGDIGHLPPSKMTTM